MAILGRRRFAYEPNWLKLKLEYNPVIYTIRITSLKMGFIFSSLVFIFGHSVVLCGDDGGFLHYRRHINL